MGKKRISTSSTTKLIRSQSTTNDNEKQPNLNDNVNQLVAQAIAVWKKEYQLEIETLRAEVIEIKESQAFICNQYDSLTAEYDKLIEVNTLQKEEISNLKSQAAALKTQEIKDSIKVDELEQYGRRQNLEIVGVPEKEDENTNAIVLEVAKMLDVDIMSSHISTSHRLPKKKASSRNNSGSSPIIVRFTSRDIRNQIYANRKKARFVDLKNFSVSDTKNIFVNENLTPTRKQLFWKTKQEVKNNSWKYIWTHNGNVFVKKDDNASITAIKNELDLNLIKKLSYRTVFCNFLLFI